MRLRKKQRLETYLRLYEIFAKTEGNGARWTDKEGNKKSAREAAVHELNFIYEDLR